MRTIILALFALMISGGVWGQDTVSVYNKNNIQVNVVENIPKPKMETITWAEYNKPKENRYHSITKVEILDNGLFKITGFKSKEQSKMSEISSFILNGAEKNNVFQVYTYGCQFNPSLITVPFKIRHSNKNVDYSRAYSDVNNVGLDLSWYNLKWERYFTNGKKSEHILKTGFLFAPMVEKLDENNTKPGFDITKSSSQLFLSLGITFSYAYNDINFVFVPLGLDYGFGSVSKSWVYNGKPWLGFGIGIDPKIFAKKDNTK